MYSKFRIKVRTSWNHRYNNQRILVALETFTRPSVCVSFENGWGKCVFVSVVVGEECDLLNLYPLWWCERVNATPLETTDMPHSKQLHCSVVYVLAYTDYVKLSVAKAVGQDRCERFLTPLCVFYWICVTFVHCCSYCVGYGDTNH